MMTQLRGKRIWLFAICASLLFHALFFFCCGGFERKRAELPVRVRLVEYRRAATALSVSKSTEKAQTAKSKTAKKELQIKKNVASVGEISQNAADANAKSGSPASVTSGDGQETLQSAGEKGQTEAAAYSGESAPEQIVDINTLVITKKVTPAYPAFSRKRQEEGTVQLLITILENSVSECKIEKSSGYGRLDASARAAVLQWKFSGVAKGKARVPVSFSIKD